MKPTPERLARMIAALPSSHFPDRDLTPAEQAEHEWLLEQAIEAEQNRVQAFLRYWTQPGHREYKIAKARARWARVYGDAQPGPGWKPVSRGIGRGRRSVKPLLPTLRAGKQQAPTRVRHSKSV